MKLFAIVLGATMVMGAAACGKKAEEAKPGEAPKAGEPAKEGGGGDLPATCTKYLDTFKKCVGGMPEAARGQMDSALKQTQEAWSKVPKDAMEAACKQAWDAAKGSMGTMCPDVKWE